MPAAAPVTRLCSVLAAGAAATNWNLNPMPPSLPCREDQRSLQEYWRRKHQYCYFSTRCRNIKRGCRFVHAPPRAGFRYTKVGTSLKVRLERDT